MADTDKNDDETTGQGGQIGGSGGFIDTSAKSDDRSAQHQSGTSTEAKTKQGDGDDTSATPAAVPGPIERGEVFPVDEARRAYDRERGLFRLTLIGFPAAGKTQFLNTLKKVLTNHPWYGGPLSGVIGSRVSSGAARLLGGRGRYEIEPGEANKGGQTAGMWAHYFWWESGSPTLADPDDAAKEEAGAASAPDSGSRWRIPDFLSRFRRPTSPTHDGSQSRSFVIYDVSGETLLSALDQTADAPAALYDIVADSDALIVLLPSNYLLSAGTDIALLAAAIQDSLAHPPGAATDEASATAGQSSIIDLVKRKTANEAQTEQANLKTQHEKLLAAITGFRQDGTVFVPSEDDQKRSRASIAELEEQYQNLDAFRKEIQKVLAVSARMRAGKLSYIDYQKLNDNEKDRLRKLSRSKRPLAYFAMSKSDTVIYSQPPIVPLSSNVIKAVSAAHKGTPPSDKEADWLPEQEVRDLLDLYPKKVFSTANGDRLANLDDLFASTKIDFLTTCKPKVPKLLFDASKENAYDASLVSGELKDAFGVDAVITWIQYARSRRTRAGSRLRRARGKLFRFTEFFEGGIAALGKTFALTFAGIGFALLLGVGFVSADYASGRMAATFAGDVGNERIVPLPRYPSEVAYLRQQDQLFRTGRPSERIRTWYEVPDDPGGFFSAVRGPRAADRERRAVYERINAGTARWSPRQIVPESATEDVIESLTSLQEAEEARTAGSNSELSQIRAFSHYHLGLAHFHDGLREMREQPDNPAAGKDAFDEAARSFASLTGLLEDNTASNEAGQRRLLGMKIAGYHARGLSELMSGDAANALASLTSATDLIPEPGSRERNLISNDLGTLLLDESDAGRSPARYSTLDIYADLLAAHIATFDAATDLSETSPTAALLDRLRARLGEIPAGHRIKPNLAILASLMGRPLMDIPTPDNSTDSRSRAAMELAVDAASRQGVWERAARLRQGFGEGDPDAVREVLEGLGGSERTSTDRNLVNALATEIMEAERERLKDKGQSELLVPYLGIAGFDSDDLARDVSGGDFLYQLRWWLPFVAFVLLGILLFTIAVRAAETADIQHANKHRKDRERGTSRLGQATMKIGERPKRVVD